MPTVPPSSTTPARWSFRRFHQRITRFGNAMHGLGLAKGDRIALLLPDFREYLEADYGAMAAGFVRVPMDPRLTRRELAELLQRAGARALVTHPSFADKVEGLTDDVESLQSIVCVGKGPGLDYEALLEKSSEHPLPEGDGDDLATLNFSGGTTGAPKAVMLRHRNLMTVAQNTIQGFDIASDAVFLNVRPLWPIAQVILMSHLFAGATVVLGGRFDPDRLATIDRPERRHPHVAGADAARALARASAPTGSHAEAAGDLCRRLADSVRGVRARARSHRAAHRRALRHDRGADLLLPAAA